MNNSETLNKISKRLEMILNAEIRIQSGTSTKWTRKLEGNIYDYSREIAKLVDEFNGVVPVPAVKKVTAPVQTPAQTVAQSRDWKTDPASVAQIALLRRMNVRIESGMTKGRASLLIDAARGQYLGSVNGFYTDGSN